MQNDEEYSLFVKSDKILTENFACCLAMVSFIKTHLQKFSLYERLPAYNPQLIEIENKLF